jgi:hypothetical protein
MADNKLNALVSDSVMCSFKKVRQAIYCAVVAGIVLPVPWTKEQGL